MLLIFNNFFDFLKKYVKLYFSRLKLSFFAIAIFLIGVSPALAFKIPIHNRATIETLQELQFDEITALEAGAANGFTDILEPHVQAAHMDDGRLGDGLARLSEKRKNIVDHLKSCNRLRAVYNFGQALHTVQDVYSHSNSIDNGIAIKFGNLDDSSNLKNIPKEKNGVTLDLNLNSPFFCKPDQNFNSKELVSGYFNLIEFAKGVLVPNENWKKLHNQCTGTPTGYCCHEDLNKDNDIPADTPNYARFNAAISAAKNGTKEYYALIEKQIRSDGGKNADSMLKIFKKAQRKEYFVMDTTGSMSNDLAGVKSAINSFVSQIRNSGEVPTLGLVTFKDNAQLEDEFCLDPDVFLNKVNQLSASGGGDCPEASNAALLTALTQFTVPSVEHKLQNSGRIHLATDASAGDAYLGPLVDTMSRSYNVPIDAILTGDCRAESRSFGLTKVSDNQNTRSANTAPLSSKSLVNDPLTSDSAQTQLRALTQSTGGVFFQVERNEVGHVVPVMMDLGNPETATLLTRQLTLSGSLNLDIPIDDTLSTVSFMAALSQKGSSLPSISLIRPNGATVSLSDADVKILTLSSVVTYSIKNPAIGNWRMQLIGQHPVNVRVYGISSLNLHTLTFLQNDFVPPRPHVDAMPRDGAPVIGEMNKARLTVTGHPDVKFIQALEKNGNLLKSSVPTSQDKQTYNFNIETPANNFIVHIRGITPKGHLFVRESPMLIAPQNFALAMSPKGTETPRGHPAKFVLTLRNASNQAVTYRFQGYSTQGWAIELPRDETVPAGGKATLQVTLTPSSSAVVGSSDQLMVIAENINSPDMRNSVSSTVTVNDNLPPVCTNAIASPDKLWPPNHELVPIQIKGISDPNGDVLKIQVSRITQDEPVTGKDNGKRKDFFDADGIDSANPYVRSERAGSGNGRVYNIYFSAEDFHGGKCEGKINVSVPHSASHPAINNDQEYNSINR